MGILGIYASQISGHLLPPSDFESIATSNPSGTGTVTFNSIPSTFKHLQIRAIFRNSANVGGDDARIRFNNDSGASYITHRFYGNGTTVTGNSTGTSDTGTEFGYNSADGSYGANIFSASVIDILDYADTNKQKTVRILTGADNNGAGQMQYFSSLWNSTSAISRIDLFAFNYGTNNWASGTKFALYGIKG